MKVRKNGLKWVAAAAVVTGIVGCGGSGGSGVVPAGSGPTGALSASGRAVPSVNLGSTGFIQAVFLSGLDRRAVGSQIAVLRDVNFQNGTSDVVPTTESATINEVTVMLDAYSINSREIPVNLNGAPSRAFSEFPLQVSEIREVVDGNGNTQLLAGPNALNVPDPFDVRIRTFPGRQTAVQIRLDESSLRVDNTLGLFFDEDAFTKANYDPLLKAIKGHISDYVAFDLSGIRSVDRPVVDALGEPADRVYFSGDGIAISNGIGTDSIFELLDPVSIKAGAVYNGAVLNGVKAPNTYRLDELDPGDFLVTAQTGIWRNYSDVIVDNGTVNMVAFPSSDDDTRQQIVIYRKAGSTIDAMWQGEIEYASDMKSGTFHIFPVGDVDDAIPSQEVSGTITGVSVVNGVAYKGDWNITSAVPGGFPFPSSGGFGVFRR